MAWPPEAATLTWKCFYPEGASAKYACAGKSQTVIF